MKKLTFAFIIALISAMSIGTLYGAPSARKKLKQAEKLASDFSKVETARQLFNEVVADSTYTCDAHTYYVGAKIEREAYKHYYKLLSINKKDPNVDRVAMADAFMKAYTLAGKAMALDTTTDKKGVKKTQYSAELAQWISDNASAMYNAGISYLNKNLYYPKAYTAFVEFASLPDKNYFTQSESTFNDSIRATSFFYGGVMAYKDNKYEDALHAFELARKYGYTRKEVFLNQISSLSNIIKNNSDTRDSLSRRITNIADDALRIYGVKHTPVFIQKYVAGMVYENKPDSALAAIDRTLAEKTDTLMLLTMKAGVLAGMPSREKEAAETYIYAASDSTAELATLKTASKYLAIYGINLLDNVKGRNREARKQQKDIRDNYLKPALSFAQRGLALAPNDTELENTVETVTYNLH